RYMCWEPDAHVLDFKSEAKVRHSICSAYLAPCMRPTMSDPDGLAPLARGSGQPIVTLVAINLQDTVKTAQESFGILASATWSVEVDHAGRVLAAPWPVIAGQCPQISGFCCSTPRIQHRCGGFIHKQLSRPL